MARLWANAVTHAAHLQRLSVAVVFIDVAAAFASVVRELVLPLPSSADELAHRLLQRGFSQDDVYQCIAATEAHDMWTTSGDHRHLANLLSAMHAHSWFTMDALAPCWRSTSGSLAGSSLGDLIFLLAFSRVMAKARAELRTRGLVATMPLEKPPPPFPPTPSCDDPERSAPSSPSSTWTMSRSLYLPLQTGLRTVLQLLRALCSPSSQRTALW